MVVSNMPDAPEKNGKGKGKAKPIFVDPQTMTELRESEKNKSIQVGGIHPALYASILDSIAQNPAHVVVVDGKSSLKRASYTNELRKMLAAQVGYTGDLSKPRAGGNVIGVVSAFKSMVGELFAFSRQSAEMFNQPLDQVKALAFARAKDILATHPTLKDVEVDDDVLEAIWSGNEDAIEADEDEDEDEDEEDC